MILLTNVTRNGALVFLYIMFDYHYAVPVPLSINRNGIRISTFLTYENVPIYVLLLRDSLQSYKAITDEGANMINIKTVI